MKKNEKNRIAFKLSMLDSMKSTRSAFANMQMSGCGPHKSKKDYNRQASKLMARKAMSEY